jgi:aminopeptidase N
VLLAVPAFAQRLPGGVTPEHYTLWFAPDLTKATFQGRETIRVQLTKPTTTVTLHAAEIAFASVTITAGGQTQRARVSEDAKNETVTFTVDRPVPAGQASIAVTYTGLLNDKLRGFYLSEANGRRYAVSQMKPPTPGARSPRSTSRRTRRPSTSR